MIAQFETGMWEILLLTGCAGTIQKESITDKTYLYEKDGFGGDFTIQI